MRALLLAAAGLWGAIWGSFFNVAVTRFPWKEESVVRPASHCRSCKAEIAWYDNLPVLSWLLLRGKCRKCGAKFSGLYALVEALSAAVCVALVARVAPSSAEMLALPPQDVALRVLPAFLHFALAGGLIVAGLIDLRTQLLPDAITLPGIVLGFGASWWIGEPGLYGSAIGAALGAGVVLALHYGWKLLRGFEGMGLGDSKLLAMIGAWLGWEAVVFALFAGSVQGIAGWMIARPKLEEASTDEEKARAPTQVPIAFGPFLALAAVEWLVGRDWIMGWVRWFVGPPL
jgi:leader peptidase (prepilin peptidase)/N-methyltransferase